VINLLIHCPIIKSTNGKKIDVILVSPSIVGCLWDVTDKDIDNFTILLLQNLFIDKSKLVLHN